MRCRVPDGEFIIGLEEGVATGRELGLDQLPGRAWGEGAGESGSRPARGGRSVEELLLKRFLFSLDN